MSGLSLRARLTAVLATTLAVFALLSAVSYYTHSRAEDRLETGFAEELAVLTELPAHRNLLRRVDAAADNSLTTRDPAWPPRRAAAAREFAASHRRIGTLILDPVERTEWDLIGRQFEAYDAAQEEIQRRLARGEIGRAEAVRLALDNGEIDRLFEEMTRFGRLSFSTLDAQRRATRRAALATFGLVLAFGLLGSVAVSAAIARIVVAPVQALRAQAGAWRLGEPWTLRMDDGPPELLELLASLKSMAEALNAQYEKERQTGRLKSQLVSGVSHEFNNALAVIHTAHALLKESEPNTAETAPWHEMLAANIRALSAMATNLLNLGRLESGKFALEIRAVEPEGLMRSALSRLEVLAQRKKISVSLDIAPGLPRCSGDPDALGLVVANLFTNAVKYTHDGGRITLGARLRHDGRVELSVADTGIGIAPEEVAKIFDGWYRTEQGKKEAKGFGVGLALSRMILDGHGCALEVESAPGKGSRFFFSLPVYDAKTASPELVG